MKYNPEKTLEIKKELDSYRLPLITKFTKKYLIPFFRNTILFVFIIIITLGILYNRSVYGLNEWMWVANKMIFFIYFMGTVVIALIGHLAEVFSTNRLRKRLGLSQKDFKDFVERYRITGM